MANDDEDEDFELNVFRLPFYLGEFSTNSVGDFLSDIFLSSSGTLVLSVITISLLILFRSFVDDSEEHDDFIESIKEVELKGKWKQHNEKWGTSFVPPPKDVVSTVPLPETSTRIIATTPLPTQVSIVGSISTASTILVTYHDIGLNHRWCFNRLINLMNGSAMLDDVAVIHVDAPGHEDGAHPIEQANINMEMLAQQLHVVIEELHVSKFVGVGIGAGANVLLRYSSNHKVKVSGLILANPTLAEPSLSEKISLKLVKAMMFPIKMRSTSVGYMACIHYSQRALACKSLPRAFTKSYRKPTEWDNKLWFIDAFVSRDTIDRERLRALSSVSMICFSSHESAGIGLLSNRYTEEDTDSLVTELVIGGGHQRVTHMRIRGCGAQLLEERAEELLQPIKYFAAGIGASLGR